MIQKVDQDEGHHEPAPEELAALELLQEHRERILRGGFRGIAVISLYDPEPGDGDDVASIRLGGWKVRKGVVPSELVGIVFELATEIATRVRKPE